jgi:hypothetical protein
MRISQRIGWPLAPMEVHGEAFGSVTDGVPMLT